MKYYLLLFGFLTFDFHVVFAMDLSRNPRELIGNYIGRQTRSPQKTCTTVTKGAVSRGYDGDPIMGNVHLNLSYLKVNYSNHYLIFEADGYEIARVWTQSGVWKQRYNTLNSGNYGPQFSRSPESIVVSPFSIVSKSSERGFELAMWMIPSFSWNSQNYSVYVNPHNTNEFRLIVKISGSPDSPNTQLMGSQSIDCTFNRR